MNERIQALAAQAKNSVPQGILGVDKWIEFYNEKFAELIVKECAMVADQWVDNEDNGRNLVSERLKQHFGVEE